MTDRVLVRGSIVDLDDRYKRIVIEVEQGPKFLVGGYAVCPMERSYTALGAAADADVINVGDQIEFFVAATQKGQT